MHIQRKRAKQIMMDKIKRGKACVQKLKKTGTKNKMVEIFCERGIQKE